MQRVVIPQGCDSRAYVLMRAMTAANISAANAHMCQTSANPSPWRYLKSTPAQVFFGHVDGMRANSGRL
jgi:hypothetical protein